MNNKIGSINEAFFLVSTFILLIILTVVFFLGISWIKTVDYFSFDNFFSDDKNEISISEGIFCENEIQDVLFKILNTEVIIDGTTKKVKEAIEDSTLTDDLFEQVSQEYFLDAFPKNSWKETITYWGVKILDSDGKTLEQGWNYLEAGGSACFDDVFTGIYIGDKKIVGCITKTYCEEMK